MPVIMKDNVQYAYTTKGTVFHTLSNAEYEALTEEEKMNGDVYCIPDREPILNPDQLWEKVGTDELETEAQDLSGAVNELNANKIKRFTRSGTTNVTTTDGTLYDCRFAITYNADMVLSVAFRVLLQNVPANERPVVTISGLPDDIPGADGIGALTQRGSDTTLLGDGCKFVINANTKTLTIDAYNFMGTVRAGWVCFLSPGLYI